MFICRLSKKKKRKSYKELEFTKLEFHKDIKNYLFLSLCLFVDYPKKKKKVIRNLSLPSSSSIKTKNYLFLNLCLFVDYPKKKSCKGLMLTKLEFHITRNSSLMSLSTVEKK